MGNKIQSFLLLKITLYSKYILNTKNVVFENEFRS